MEPAGAVRIVCLTLVQTIYQRPMRTDDVFSSSAMGSLMDKEMKKLTVITRKGWGSMECCQDWCLPPMGVLLSPGRVYLLMWKCRRDVPCLENPLCTLALLLFLCGLQALV